MTSSVGQICLDAMNIALSPSRVADYRQCPLLYRFRALDRLPEEPTLAQVKGILVHACLEKMYGWLREERTYPAVVKLLKPTWAKLQLKNPEYGELVPEENLLDFLVECRELLKNYFYMENPQGFDAYANEKFIETVLPNGVPVKGFIDRVDIAPTGEVRVVDYKTGKKPKPQYSQSAKFQMRFYALVWWRLYGVIPNQTRLMYLPAQDSLYAQPYQEDLEACERELGEVWQQIMADIAAQSFTTKKGVLCGWCSHQALCPEFGGTPPPFPENIALT